MNLLVKNVVTIPFISSSHKGVYTCTDSNPSRFKNSTLYSWIIVCCVVDGLPYGSELACCG